MVFAHSMAMRPQAAGNPSDDRIAVAQILNRKTAKAAAPITPVQDSIIAANDDGRLAPSPTPSPQVCDTI